MRNDGMAKLFVRPRTIYNQFTPGVVLGGAVLDEYGVVVGGVVLDGYSCSLRSPYNLLKTLPVEFQSFSKQSSFRSALLNKKSISQAMTRASYFYRSS